MSTGHLRYDVRVRNGEIIRERERERWVPGIFGMMIGE